MSKSLIDRNILQPYYYFDDNPKLGPLLYGGKRYLKCLVIPQWKKLIVKENQRNLL